MALAEQVTLEVEGAGWMTAHVAQPAGAARGGILLLQEASVSFYGSGIPRLLNRLAELSAPMVLLWGAQDAVIDAKQRQQVVQALDLAQKPYTHALFSMAGHGFFCDQRASYNRPAAVQSWALTEAFLAEQLGV